MADEQEYPFISPNDIQKDDRLVVKFEAGRVHAIEYTAGYGADAYNAGTHFLIYREPEALPQKKNAVVQFADQHTALRGGVYWVDRGARFYDDAELIEKYGSEFTVLYPGDNDEN